METDDKALEYLEKISQDADLVQEKLLMKILSKNKATDYGRKYHFAEIHDHTEYREKLPVTGYSEYEGRIKRQIGGESKLLMEDKPCFYCISAGSTKEPGYVPVSPDDIPVHRRYLMDLPMEIVQRDLPQYSREELYGKIFETSDFFRTQMADGTMNGVRSGLLHCWLREKGGLPPEDVYTSPREVMFPEELGDMLYIKLRFALASREITAVHGVFVHRLTSVFHFLIRNWEAMIEDVASGEVGSGFHIGDYWKEYLKQKLPADPKRARELAAIPRENLKEGLLLKIWPKLKFIRCICGDLWVIYFEELNRLSGGLPVHYYAYASSEGIFGVPLKLGGEARYVLLADSCFFEFLPARTQDNTPLTFSEVQKGEKYELLITTTGGLYRYALGDIVEVVGFYGKAPVIRFCFRKNQLLNLVDEKMSVRQLARAMESFEKETGYHLEGYLVEEEPEAYPPYYRIYLECTEDFSPKEAAGVLDHCIQKNCLGYKSARSMGQAGQLQLLSLKPGSFRAYETYLGNSGRRLEQNKPPLVIRTGWQKDFFAGCLKSEEEVKW